MSLKSLLLPLLLLAPAFANAEEIALFDGKNLDAWRGYKMDSVPKGWTIENGLLYCDGASKTDLVTKQEFGNFELTAKWKTEAGGNSGILILADETAKQIWNHAPEVQIFDKSPKDTTLMHQAGALYDLYPAKAESLKPAGEWNETKITVQDGTITVVHNGATVCSVKVGSEEWNTKVAASKFGKFERFAKNPKGLIGLQDHGHKVWFESIKLKTL